MLSFPLIVLYCFIDTVFGTFSSSHFEKDLLIFNRYMFLLLFSVPFISVDITGILVLYSVSDHSSIKSLTDLILLDSTKSLIYLYIEFLNCEHLFV